MRDRPGHDRRYAMDAGKIERELGWKPAENFESGLRRTVAWYLENAAWINDVTSGFPVSLFLTLSGVTLLFAQAQQNRTLDRIAHRAVRLCRGNAGLIPVMFFVLGCALAWCSPVLGFLGQAELAKTLRPLYDYAWFVGFGVGFAGYALLSRAGREAPGASAAA